MWEVWDFSSPSSPSSPSSKSHLRPNIKNLHPLKSILNKKGYSTGVGDEGGFAPDLKFNEEAVEVILEAITAGGYKPGEDISICLDPATSELWRDGKYLLFKSTKELPIQF